MSDLLISEIFGPVIQGEGAHIGEPTVFVRAAGCDYRCSWCDSMYAVDPIHKPEWKKMSSEDVFEQVADLATNKPILITLSGGNPALQDFNEFLDLARGFHYPVTIETQGTKNPTWLGRLDSVTISPKPPSSGHVTSKEHIYSCIAQCHCHVDLKIVVFDDKDFDYAKDKFRAFQPIAKCFLQIGTVLDKDESAILGDLKTWQERILEEKLYHVRVLPQLHTLIYGQVRGV